EAAAKGSASPCGRAKRPCKPAANGQMSSGSRPHRAPVPASSRSRSTRSRSGTSARRRPSTSRTAVDAVAWCVEHARRGARARSESSPPSSSAHRPLDEIGDLLFLGPRQPRQRKRGRPHVAVVEVGLVAEAERRVPRLELRRVLEEADDLPVLRVGRHAVPGARLEPGRGLDDDGVHPLGHGAVGVGHSRDQCEHDLLALRILQRLLHRDPFFCREFPAHRLPFVRSTTSGSPSPPAPTPAPRVISYQASGRPSRKNPPAGPSRSSVAAHTTLAAPRPTGRPPRPPMSVAVQPGQTAFTRIAGSSAARILVSAFNAAFEMLYAGVPPPIEASEPP